MEPGNNLTVSNTFLRPVSDALTVAGFVQLGEVQRILKREL